MKTAVVFVGQHQLFDIFLYDLIKRSSPTVDTLYVVLLADESERQASGAFCPRTENTKAWIDALALRNVYVAEHFGDEASFCVAAKATYVVTKARGELVFTFCDDVRRRDTYN